MTQFQPPPDVPGIPAGPEPSPAPTAQAPYSASAIIGFVLSLLGCTAVGALLGLVFGIVGIVRTGSGRRRGRGLAIAAVAISVVTGTFGGVIGYSALTFKNAGVMYKQLSDLFAGESGRADAVLFLRKASSDEFDQAVDDQKLDAWLEQVASKHGRLVTLGQPKPVSPPPSPDEFALGVECKFVGGPVSVVITLTKEDWPYKIGDIAVDGLSPRDLD